MGTASKTRHHFIKGALTPPSPPTSAFMIWSRAWTTPAPLPRKEAPTTNTVSACGTNVLPATIKKQPAGIAWPLNKIIRTPCIAFASYRTEGWACLKTTKKRCGGAVSRQIQDRQAPC